MNDLGPGATDLERRVVILPPSAADGAVALQVLTAAAVEAALCATPQELCATAEAGAAVLVLAEEALVGAGFQCLSDFLARQPVWSDIPLVVLTTRRPEPTTHWRTIVDLSWIRNAMMLERPMRTEMLLQAVRVAVRTRDRQYQLRSFIAEREGLLKQRDMLLREVHHRVKNNLQMMQSLIRLSAARAPSQAEPLFTDLFGRIAAIGELHAQIYARENFTEVDAAAYLSAIADQVGAAFGLPALRVRIVRQLAPITVDVDTAIPLGLITAELLTNAYRYAFPDGSTGEVCLYLALHDGIIELTVADNGVGLPTAEASCASTGLRLVKALAKQIGGKLSMPAGPGVRGTVRFPLKERSTGAAP